MVYDFGLLLRELRLAKKLSQAQVAKRLNLHKSMVSCYENNTKSPTIETLSQLAIIYNVTTDYLLGHEKRRSIFVDGLSERQLDIINTLLLEFRHQ
jgi:transcriptional regulator with XRE-family HTH domain